MPLMKIVIQQDQLAELYYLSIDFGDARIREESFSNRLVIAKLGDTLIAWPQSSTCQRHSKTASSPVRWTSANAAKYNETV